MSKEKETGKEKGRIRQLARYYIPYKGLFFTDMFFAMLGAAITLVIPLIVRYITSTVVEKPLEQATSEIIRLGILMIAMVLVEMYCNFYIAYYGHVMGARIEHDMRNEMGAVRSARTAASSAIIRSFRLLFSITRRSAICCHASQAICSISVSFYIMGRRILSFRLSN